MAGADVQATYGIQLAVEGTESADDAAEALERLRDEIAEDTAALRAMQSTLRSLQGSTTTSAAQFKQLRDAIAAKKLAVAQGSQSLLKMKGAFDGLGPSAKRAKEAQVAEGIAAKTAAKLKADADRAAAKSAADHKSSLAKLRGEAGLVEPSFRGLRLSTLAQVPAALGAAAAITVLVGGLALATAAFARFGIAAADARRNEALMIQAAGTHLWYGYGVEASRAADLTADGANAIQYAIDRVSGSTAIGRDRIAGFAQELLKARLGGQDLEKALKAVSQAASVGKEAGLVGAFASLKFMGQSVDKLANLVDQKFGGIVRRQMLGLDVQAMRLRENLSKLWKGINIEPFLEAINKVLRLFSVSTASGYALKHLLEALFPETAAQKFGDVGAKAFKLLVIGAQYLVLSVLTVRKKFQELDEWIDKTFGNGSKKVEAFRIGLESLKDVLLNLMPGGNFIRSGVAVVDGITSGIESEKSGPLNAVAELGKAMLRSFSTSIDAHSPSRLFEKYARFAPEGAVLGIRAGTPDVRQAVGDMVGEIPSTAAQGADTAAPARPSIVVQVTAPISIGDTGGKDAKALVAGLEPEVTALFERAAQQLAATLEPA